MSKYSNNMPPDLRGAIAWMYGHIEPQTTVLDFGCSTGYFGKVLKRDKKCKVYGAEVSEDAAKARKVLDGVYSFDLDGSWSKEVYERKYDYLFFGDVLEHLKDPGAVLEKSKKLLKDDSSRVFISIPNIAHVSIRLELLQGNFEPEPMGILDNTHLQYFTLRTFTQLANDAGYQVVRVDYSLNDYPKEIVEQILGKIGLKAKDKFWKIVNTREARAYQYKFILKSTNKKIIQKNKLPLMEMPEKPEHLRDGILNSLREQLDTLHEHANKQAVIIKHYTDRCKHLEGENNYFKSRPAYKISRNIKIIIDKP